jgi:hypothetical protein
VREIALTSYLIRPAWNVVPVFVPAATGQLRGRILSQVTPIAWGGVSLVLFLYLAVALSADDHVITEKSFGCLLDLPKVRNTRIQNPDPENLRKAIRIPKDSVPDKEYHRGTILQLIPTEAMVKHDRGPCHRSADNRDPVCRPTL